MRTETLAGVLVLALVAGGVYWARGRGPGPSGPGAPADAPVPDVTHADGTWEQGDIRVTLSVSPRPPVAFQAIHVRVLAEARGAPVVIEGARVAFEMTMPMGDHRYTLAPGADGWQHAEVVLPFCKSGNPRWHATVEGTTGGRLLTARFRLDLTRP